MSRSFAGQMSLALSPPVTSYSAPVTMFAASEASRLHRRSTRSGPSDDVRLIKCAAGCRIRIPHAEDWLQKIVPRECQLLRRHQLPGAERRTLCRRAPPPQVGPLAAAWSGPSLANWTAKVEYLYVDVPGTSFTSVNSNPVAFPNSTIAHTHGDLTENIVRIGVNYKFW
jgi:hypothetical protein